MVLERSQLNPNQDSPTIATSFHDLGINIDYLPKLAADGSNWGSYRNRMVFHLGCCIDPLADHLTNAEVPKSEPGAGAETAEATIRWKHDDAIVQHCIAVSIPDEVFAVVQRGTSAKDFWDNLEAQFEIKSRRIRAEVMRKLYNQKCRNNDDVRAHLARLFSLREQLFGAGGSISDNDFSYLILDTLPDAYDTLISSIRIAAFFGKKERNLSPYDVNELIISDYERKISRSLTPRSSNRGYRR
jgi:hypothetical protein